MSAIFAILFYFSGVLYSAHLIESRNKGEDIDWCMADVFCTLSWIFVLIVCICDVFAYVKKD